MNGTPYTFDANGNLLNDGTSTYTYDAASRLKTAMQGATVSSYAYNGLGDRLRQTVNSVTTNYTLDLNTGLTQVLADGTNTYLYGNGRMGEQQLTGFAYHLGDALGSVRQLTNGLGLVTLMRNYEPFGSPLTSVGVAGTVFQFTGEQRDSATGLTFLRARFLSTATGRFISRDTWRGSSLQPMSHNMWLYVYANPIKLTDPTGQDPWQPDADCVQGQSPRECAAYFRVLQIIDEVRPNGAEALFRLFEDDKLLHTWGDITGQTTSRRLEWILRITQNDWPLPTHFAIPFSNDCGFAEEFRDSQFYPKWYSDLPPEVARTMSNQVGHFLSAVDITYNQWSLGAIIGHEQVPDKTFQNLFQDLFVTPDDFEHWYKAVEYDEQGQTNKRDAELWLILHFKSSTPFEGVEEKRVGNSLQDLRLSLKGFRFARWVWANENLPAVSAASWLRLNLSADKGAYTRT